MGLLGVHSKASKTAMFAASSGSISSAVCTGANIIAPAFSPQSTLELKIAVDACLKLSPKGDCFTDIHGPIGEWDVSRVTDMGYLFFIAKEFDADISTWDVSDVTSMCEMFSFTGAFNSDISKWDVSSVNDELHVFRCKYV